MSDKVDIATLVATHARGFGEVKLARLADDKIDTLVKHLAPEAKSVTRAEKLDAILAAKRRQARAAKRTTKVVLESVLEFRKAPQEAPPTCPEAASATPPSPPPTPNSVIDTPRREDAFAPEAASLKVIAFNSLGLRFVQEEAQMLAEFKALTARFADADVVMLSEVVPSSVQTRVYALRTGLMTDSGKHWNVSVSTPSKGGLADGKVECHAVLVKAPLRVSEALTQLSAEGCKLDYAPFTVAISAHGLQYKDSPVDVLLTSVHMPPAARQGARDRQLKALLSAYERLSEMRMNRPFTMHAAREQKSRPCVHALVGDFNRHPAELATQGWCTLLPQAAKTSAGGKAYDNVVLNADALEMVNARWDVLALARYAKPGVRGLSDHAPVELELRAL